MKDEKNIQEVFDLSDYEKCEELRKSKSRSKKNHSKFTLAHSKQPGNTVCSRPRAAGATRPPGHQVGSADTASSPVLPLSSLGTAALGYWSPLDFII